MEKVYVPYIIYKESSGFFNETKFQAELNIDELLKNDGIVTSFYDEQVKVECLNGVLSENGNHILIKDGKAVEITQDEIVKKITDLFTKLSYEAINAKYMDYKRDDKDISNAENIAVMLSNFGYKVDLNEKRTFNEENYLNLAKELSLYTSIYLPLANKETMHYIHEIKKTTMALNTTLAVNDVLKFTADDAPARQFSINSYEDADGNNVYSFNYSSLDLIEARTFRSLYILNATKNKNNTPKI